MSDDCLQILDKWIIRKKREVHEQTIQSSDPMELNTYRNILLDLEKQLRIGITNENDTLLKSLGWPEELLECIKEMGIKIEIKDRLRESLCIHPHNRSPEHEDELHKENQGLR